MNRLYNGLHSSEIPPSGEERGFLSRTAAGNRVYMQNRSQARNIRIVGKMPKKRSMKEIQCGVKLAGKMLLRGAQRVQQHNSEMAVTMYLSDLKFAV